MSSEIVHFENYEIQIERKSKCRSVTVFMAPKRPIIVRTGLKTSHYFILSFLKSKIGWIEKNLKRIKEIENQYPEKRIREDEVFPFRGVDYALRVVITPGKKYFISLPEMNAERTMLLHVPLKEWHALSKKLEYENQIHTLRVFYKRESSRFLIERVNYLSQQMELYPSQIKFREQKSRWGSCSTNKIINLNWRLIIFSDEIIDYVLIHELAHLQHLNHSESFWSLVKKFCPQYKEISKRLKRSQGLTGFLDL